MYFTSHLLVSHCLDLFVMTGVHALLEYVGLPLPLLILSAAPNVSNYNSGLLNL